MIIGSPQLSEGISGILDAQNNLLGHVYVWNQGYGTIEVWTIWTSTSSFEKQGELNVVWQAKFDANQGQSLLDDLKAGTANAKILHYCVAPARALSVPSSMSDKVEGATREVFLTRDGNTNQAIGFLFTEDHQNGERLRVHHFLLDSSYKSPSGIGEYLRIGKQVKNTDDAKVFLALATKDGMAGQYFVTTSLWTKHT